MELFPAHIRIELRIELRDQRTCEVIQSVEEHCRNTANYAGGALSSIGLYHAAYLAGLLHDCGKLTEKFKTYLWDACQGKDVCRGSVNHTFAGCRMLLEHFHGTGDYRDVTCELLAYAVGAHHGQFDCIDEKGKSGFVHRIQKENTGYEESSRNFLKLCSDWPELDRLFEKAHEELMPVYQTLSAVADENENGGDEQLMFSVGQLARLLLSAVIEGDRRDTAEFMDSIQIPEQPRDYPQFWGNLLNHVEQKLQQFPQETRIQAARAEISEQCRQAAEKSGGIYRLNVPTGGGKTLSSLRYALAHASRWGKQRILFVTPLLTILEQNAAIIREFIGDDSVITEHHSNVICTQEDGEALDLRELATESWHAPVIITTLVQLLNTLFLGKTTSIRRYQALCNAVVVIDEVQTVPNHMLSLFNTAVNFLSAVCGTTFLLCSATQPCFEKAEHPLRLKPDSEIIPYQESLWKPFRRTVIQDSGAMRMEQIPEFIQNILQKVNSLLIICNKKAESEYLYRSICLEKLNCFHLSSSMCMAHRRDVLSEIQTSLDSGKKTVCISTQVMEAGVDISFGSVIRLAAGMDSVVQAAGRCNRNGESCEPSLVYLVQCSDENLGKLQEIKLGKQVTIALLHQFQKEPDRFSYDLSSDAAINWYYRKLFQEQNEGFQQYTVKKHGTIFRLLSSNMDYFDPENPATAGYTINQAFQTAGSLFHVLDDSTEDLVVPYGAGEALIAELAGYPQQVSPAVLRKWVQKAKPYTVSVYDYQKAKLADALVSIHGILVLRPEYYDDQTGLITKPEAAFMEV